MDVKNIRDSIKREMKAELKPRKLLRTAFIPQTKGLLTPIKEAFEVFVLLIAQMFVGAKLITRDHPAYKREIQGPGALWLLIVDASTNLKFKRENIYQIIVFYGIVGMLVFGALGFVSFVMQFGMGHAHAQALNNTGSLFNETNSNDQAPNWINSMFPYSNNSTGTGLASALGGLLQVYNSALLALGTAFLLYQLAHLFMESAHHGSFGGKNYSQLHAPLRMVIGIGLLVPMSNGYNSAEIIAIEMAKMGSGLASQVWSQFQTELANLSGQQSSVPLGEVNTMLQQLALDETCMVARQSAAGTTTKPTWSSYGTTVGNNFVIDFGNSATPGDSFCGTLSIPLETEFSSTPGTAFETAFTTSGTGILDEVWSVADMIYQMSGGGTTVSTTVDPTINPLSTSCTQQNKSNSGAGGNCYPPSGTSATGTGWAALLSQADASIVTAENSVYSAYQTYATANTNNAATDWSNAGYLFLTMTHNAGLLYQAQNPQLTVTMPDSTVMAAVDNRPMDCSGFWIKFLYLCNANGQSVIKATVAASKMISDGVTAIGMPAVSFTPSSIGGGAGGGGLLNKILLSPVNALWSGVSTAAGCSGAGTSFKCGGTSNASGHFGQSIFNVMALGNVMLYAASAFYAIGALTGLTISGDVAGIISVMIGSLLFPLGVSLAIMIPLMPAARFLFGIFTWLITLFEAMVAMPLVALVTINFNGDGLFAHGQQGWFVLLQMMLRPVLMIFGLIGGLLIFDTLSGFISQTIFGAFLGLANATTATNGVAGSAILTIMQLIGFLYFYCFTLYALANTCFSLVNTIPDRILGEWVGLLRGGPTTQDTEQVASQASSSTSGALTKAGQTGVDIGAKTGKAIEDNRNAKNEGDIAAKRHQELITSIDRAGYSSSRTPGEIQQDANDENARRDAAKTQGGGGNNIIAPK